MIGRRTIGFFLAIVIVASAVGIFIGWWTSRTPELSLPPTTATTAQSGPVNTPASETNSTTAGPRNSAVMVGTDLPGETVEPLDPDELPVPSATDDPIWRKDLESILANETNETARAQRLWSYYQTNSHPDAKAETMQHLVNYVQDAEYPMLRNVLLTTNTVSPVHAVLMADLINRASGLKMPLFLQIARTPGHPLNEEASELLKIYTEKDFGNNWGQWEQAVQDYIRENPE